MSKTIDLQVEKSRTLIQGMRNNLAALANWGVAGADLDRMDEALQQLDKANKECEAIREQLSRKVKDVNAILASVKTEFADKKKVVKNNFLQEEWARFGVLDKR